MRAGKACDFCRDTMRNELKLAIVVCILASSSHLDLSSSLYAGETSMHGALIDFKRQILQALKFLLPEC